MYFLGQYNELSRILTVERQLLTDSRSFFLPNFVKETFKIDTIFDWNAMNMQDGKDIDELEINQLDLNILKEQWRKIMCEKRSCSHVKTYQQMNEEFQKIDELNIKNETEWNSQNQDLHEIQNEKEHRIYSPYECESEPNLDTILHRQPAREIDLNSDTCSLIVVEDSHSTSLHSEKAEILLKDDDNNHHQIEQNNESKTLDTLIVDLLKGRVTTETLSEDYQQLLAERKKSYKTPSIPVSVPSLPSPILDKQQNMICDFLNQMFFFENDTSKHHTLGRNEDWIAAASATYTHPFDNHTYQQCLVEEEGAKR